MNGATADPCATTIKSPSNNMITMIGSNQNFFLTFRKAQSSLMRDMILKLFGDYLGREFRAFVGKMN